MYIENFIWLVCTNYISRRKRLVPRKQKFITGAEKTHIQGI